MTAYLRYNGYHFNAKLCDFAVSQMRKVSRDADRPERIEPWTKEQVDELLSRNNISLDNNVGYDYIYVANMAKADFYKSSITNETELAQFIKDYVDDRDQADGFIMNRFYADSVRAGRPIPWSEVL